MHYLHLSIAIVAEVVATSALKATEEFTRLWPTTIVLAGYAIAFYFLTLTLRVLPVGVTYALWSGLGIVLIAVAAALIYGQMPDLAAVIGMALIIAGVLVVNLFSRTVAH